MKNEELFCIFAKEKQRNEAQEHYYIIIGRFLFESCQLFHRHSASPAALGRLGCVALLVGWAMWQVGG